MLALWIAARDRRTPLAARLLALAVAGYAFSPIDLIPDFIPVLGVLDDLVLLPLGIWLVLRMIPAETMAIYRAEATALQQRPRSVSAAVVVVVLWLAAIAVIGWSFWPDA